MTADPSEESSLRPNTPSLPPPNERVAVVVNGNAKNVTREVVETLDQILLGGDLFLLLLDDLLEAIQRVLIRPIGRKGCQETENQRSQAIIQPHATSSPSHYTSFDSLLTLIQMLREYIVQANINREKSY